MTDARRIADALLAGGVALMPTDTVYGLAALPGADAAKQRIFDLKKRPENLNLQILLPENPSPESVGARLDGLAARLFADAEARPRITFILPLDPATKPAWLADRVEAGIRVPADARTQAVLALTGPLLATSANAHGKPPGETTPDILADLAGAPDAVWDAGRLVGVASTVVNFNIDPPAVLRWGAVDDLTAYGLGHA